MTSTLSRDWSRLVVQFYAAPVLDRAVAWPRVSVETTQMYLNASLQVKERILAQVPPMKGSRARYKPDDQLLAFLNRL